jgi:hypothetical protein
MATPTEIIRKLAPDRFANLLAASPKNFREDLFRKAGVKTKTNNFSLSAAPKNQVRSEKLHEAITGGLDPVASTSLGVQALVGRWLPTTRAPAVDCSPERSEFPVRPSIVVLAVIAMVLLVGSVSIMRRSEP